MRKGSGGNAVLEARALTYTSQQKLDAGDFLTVLIALASACTAAWALHQQILNFQWEESARAAFYARMPLFIYVEPLFNFAARESFINLCCVSLIALLIEFPLIRHIQARMWRIQERLSPATSSSPPISSIAPAHKQIDGSLATLASDAMVLHGFAYRGYEQLEAHELRARAETCFRLAQGPVSQALADELEALGQAFLHEAGDIR